MYSAFLGTQKDLHSMGVISSSTTNYITSYRRQLIFEGITPTIGLVTTIGLIDWLTFNVPKREILFHSTAFTWHTQHNKHNTIINTILLYSIYNCILFVMLCVSLCIIYTHMLRFVMAEGTRLLPKWALLHLIDLYLRPEGSGTKLAGEMWRDVRINKNQCD